MRAATALLALAGLLGALFGVCLCGEMAAVPPGGHDCCGSGEEVLSAAGHGCCSDRAPLPAGVAITLVSVAPAVAPQLVEPVVESLPAPTAPAAVVSSPTFLILRI